MSHQRRFTAEKIRRRLQLIRGYRFRRRVPLAPFRFAELPNASAAPPLEGPMSRFPEIPWNSYWGGRDVHFCLLSEVTIPSGWDGRIALSCPLGDTGDIFNHPEALLYIDGEPMASIDRYHHTIELLDGLTPGRVLQIALHGWTGLFGWPPNPDAPDKILMAPCHLVERAEAMDQFWVLASMTLETAEHLGPHRAEAQNLLSALDDAFVTLDTRDPLGPALWGTAEAALQVLEAGIAKAGQPMDVTLSGIGHAHMDVAYLWPIAQTRQKNARTLSNALRLMAVNEDFIFSYSQPQLYAYLEEDFPPLFARAKARIAEGRLEIMGGMWVEPDVNLPGAEALVRQLLLGRRYVADRFGPVDTPVLWLPDTFGFPACLPQLMRGAGIGHFVTNKLNWNQVNQMPHSTFTWEGLDGTQVTAHLLTTPRAVQHLPFPTNYKSDLSAREVAGTWEASQSKTDIRDLPICYGFGDGGGGPTEELISRAKAFAAMPGMPRLKMRRVADWLAAHDAAAPVLPVWSGELYMEGHRGTLTSQGWIKKANRRAEALLHEAETLVVMAQPSGADARTRADLRRAWELLCLNQFHDIITGTSVEEVMADARRDYAEIDQIVGEVKDAALAQLTQGAEASLINTAPVPRHGPIFLQGRIAGAFAPDLTQEVEGGALIDLAPVGPYASAPIRPDPLPDRPARATERPGGGVVLENAHLRVEIDATGQIFALKDLRANRPLLAPGEMGNQLNVHEDRPMSWDAWDIDPFIGDRVEPVRDLEDLEIIETGPLRAALRLIWRYRDSRVQQEIRLNHHSARLDFVTEVDWQESHALLRAAFPLDILSPEAIYEIQWGEIARPTHRNTPWDAAMFEVAAHRWVSLEEAGFGVALLNDCKYGHSVEGGRIEITLIKSPTMPDPTSDRGRHRFTYALLPHEADRRAVRAEARALNQPMTLCHGRPPDQPLVSCDAPHVVIETLKPAEDGEGFILRAYEAERRRGPVRFQFSQNMAAINRVDLLEQDLTALPPGDEIRLEIKPFEIVSFRCIPA